MRIEGARSVVTVENLKPALRRIESLRVGSPGWPVMIGVSVMALYLALLPFVARTWRATGDEPHYLLTAHSLVANRDFDLANNYAQFDYLSFYFERDIVPQVRLNAAGQQILNHHLGLPVLIAPAYALAGRFGVLVFQTMLGGVLVAMIFKLALLISQDTRASLLATLFVTLSPPLLLYQYLVYPELIAALLVTVVLHYALTQTLAQNKPAVYLTLLVAVSLAILPWLNRRFVPLAIVLALIVIWSGRHRASPPGYITGAGVVTVIMTTISIGLLFWFNSQLDSPVRADITAPLDGSAVWSRLVRGTVGWLLDQQRGLFVYAPIYMVAFWGLPILIAHSLRRHNLNWTSIVPFLISLGGVILAGGFWIAWELGPRFVVVALPTLAPLLALAWRHYGHKKIWSGVVIGLFALSLLNSIVLVRNPELPYKSSLPLFYGQKVGLPLTEILPDLAEYTRLSPADSGSNLTAVTTSDRALAWLAPAGRSANLIAPKSLADLPFGHYVLTWPLRTEPDLDPKTELGRISVKHLGGGQLLNRRITVADLPADGSFGFIQLSFLNPIVDHWRTPMILQATTTGQARLWAKPLWLKPNSVYAFVLPYLYLAILVAGALTAWYKTDRTKTTTGPQVSDSGLKLKTGRRVSGSYLGPQKLPGHSLGVSDIAGRMGWLWLLTVVILTVGYLVTIRAQSTRIYEANVLHHLVGHPITDPAAVDRQAWLVDPAVDPPQKAIYGPFDIYDAGHYRVSFRLKLTAPVNIKQEIARLQINAAANWEPLVNQPILIEHFTKPNLYHDMVLTLDNPRRQALSFEVHYLGLAPLAIDNVTIERIGD